MTCCDCGVLFGTEAGYDDRRRKDRKSFYCPNGHAQSYTGPTAEQRLRERMEMTERQLEAARQLARHENGRARAFKGHATRLRNSIAQGFCPACDTKFPDVEQHMADKHPDFHPNLQEQSQ